MILRYIYKYEHNMIPYISFIKLLAKKPQDIESNINRL